MIDLKETNKQMWNDLDSPFQMQSKIQYHQKNDTFHLIINQWMKTHEYKMVGKRQTISKLWFHLIVAKKRVKTNA